MRFYLFVSQVPGNVKDLSIVGSACVYRSDFAHNCNFVKIPGFLVWTLLKLWKRFIIKCKFKSSKLFRKQAYSSIVFFLTLYSSLSTENTVNAGYHNLVLIPIKNIYLIFRRHQSFQGLCSVDLCSALNADEQTDITIFAEFMWFIKVKFYDFYHSLGDFSIRKELYKQESGMLVKGT